MYLGVRLFIVAVFVLLGSSFLAMTGAMIHEFQQLDWLGIAAFYSHLFVFFPTFGVVALAAFYLPACVFLDMYWRHIPYGRLRFIVGFAGLIGLSVLIAQQMRQSAERSVFEVAPRVLATDAGEGCGAGGTCKRLSILKAVENVRLVSQKRMGLSDLTRNCQTDPLQEARPTGSRFCFASTPYSEKAARVGDTECCLAQRAMIGAVNSYYADPAKRSFSSELHGYLLPANVFFLGMMLVISLMLAWRRKQLEKHYAAYLPGIERGVLIGAAALVIYPVMVQAFLQSAGLILGEETPGGFRSIAPYIAFGFAMFALLVLFYFYRRRDKELQSIARIGGIVGSGIAIIKYDQIIDVFVRVFGSGAGWTNLVIVVLFAVGAIGVLFVKTFREIGGKLPVDEETITELAIEAIDRQMPR